VPQVGEGLYEAELKEVKIYLMGNMESV